MPGIPPHTEPRSQGEREIAAGLLRPIGHCLTNAGTSLIRSHQEASDAREQATVRAVFDALKEEGNGNG